MGRATFLFLLLVALQAAPLTALASWRVGLVKKDGELKPLNLVEVAPSERGDRVLRSLPFALREDPGADQGVYEERIVSDLKAFRAELGAREAARFDEIVDVGLAPDWPGSEVRALVSQGPPTNRINLTIVGDGYTSAERERFFEDARRTSDDLFKGETFRSYLALFNVYAVFVPSQDSGITDLSSKSTALGLYRDPAGSKRAIMIRNVGAAERALKLAPATDYPILLANDEFYGGLGGRYAITTRSTSSGTIVLRHELGHNFGNVGEEYDGGQVYQGANHSSSPQAPWSHWAQGSMETFESERLIGAYLWKNLARGGWSESFRVPQGSATFDFFISTVGWSSPDDVLIKIDGKRVDVVGKYHTDRSFFDPAAGPAALAPGDHVIDVSENLKDGDNVLASIEAHAYPAGYDFTPDRVGAFATFDEDGSHVGYRPTHRSCLMREMRSYKFCAVDQENMWLRFLHKVRLIDELKVQTVGAAREVVLTVPPLAGLDVRWYREEAGRSTELVDLRGARNWPVESTLHGRVRAVVTFTTPEVRKPSKDFTQEASIQL